MAKQKEESVYGTTAEIAKDLGKTVQRINQYVTNDGAPKVDKDKFHKAEFYLWYIDYRQQECEKKLSESISELDREKTRMAKASADKQERENAIAEGRIVPVEIFKDKLLAIVARLSGKLDSLPNKLATEIISCKNLMEAKEKAKEIINNVKYELGGTKPQPEKKPVKKSAKRKKLKK